MQFLHCSNATRKTVLYLLLLSLCAAAEALDIAFVSYSAITPDSASFSFIALSKIPGSREITFTNNGVTSTGTLLEEKGFCSYTAPEDGLTAGDVVEIVGESANVGVVTSNTMLLASTGDQIIAFTSDISDPTFIAGVSFFLDGSFLQNEANIYTNTTLPPGLFFGRSALSLPGLSSVVYNGETSGSISELRTSLFNPSTFEDFDGPVSFSGTFSFTPSQTTSCVGYAEASAISGSSTPIRQVNQEIIDGIVDEEVSVEGIVILDLRGKSLNGFIIQAPASHASELPLPGEASDGIQIVCSEDCGEFAAGDLVLVTGTTTAIESNPVIVSPVIQVLAAAFDVEAQPENELCPPLAAAVNIADITLPFDSVALLSSFRNMLVNVPQNVTITNSFTLHSGSIAVSGDGVLVESTMLYKPGSEEYFAHEDFNARNFLQLDDVTGGDCPDPQLYFNPVASGVRTGWEIPATALDATTVLTFTDDFNGFALVPNAIGQQIIPESYDETTNPRVDTVKPFTPQNLGNSVPIQISSVNMLNYFVDINDENCPSCRGADTEEEFALQSAKLYAVIRELDAAVFGLEEVQNSPDDTVLQQLVEELNAFLRVEGKYDFISVGELGSDAITNAIIYQPLLVTPIGDTATLIFVDPIEKSRPAIAQSFDIVTEYSCGVVQEKLNFTVIVNHLKSKGSACDEDVALEGIPGESSCGLARLKHVNQLLDWIETNPTGVASDNWALLGDFNSNKEERSVDAIISSGYINMAARDLSAEDLYSLSFNGRFGTLDYIFASPSLASSCGNTFEWHINSDEPILTDYNDEQYQCGAKPANFHTTSVFRASDHDPIMTFCQFTCPVEIVSFPDDSNGANQKLIAGIIIAIALAVIALAARYERYRGPKEVDEDEDIIEKSKTKPPPNMKVSEAKHKSSKRDSATTLSQQNPLFDQHNK